MVYLIARRACGWMLLLAAFAAEPSAAKPSEPKVASQHSVQIRRDTWGVPHILASTDIDAAYGLGFAQAEDDMLTMQASVFTGRGKLAELIGPSGVDSDYMVAL